MASVNQMFVTMMTEGMAAAKAISDPEKKAIACAELAKALSMTGLIVIGDSPMPATEPEQAKEALKEKPKAKQKSSSKKVVAKEEPVEEEVAEEEPEVEIVEEWTEEMLEMFSEQLQAIQTLQEEYEEETLDECVRDFSEGVLNSIEDITPLNIDGFIAYIDLLMAAAETEEAAE